MGGIGAALIVMLLDAADVQPAALVTVKLYVPSAKPVIVRVDVLPVILPGLIVQLPDGKPLRVTLPVGVLQVGWVGVPAVGAVGVVLTVIVTCPQLPLVQPPPSPRT